MYLLQDGFIAELFLRMEVDLTRKEHTFQHIIGFLTGEKVSCNLWKYAQKNLIPCWWKSKKSILKYFGTKNSFHQNLSSKHHNQSEELEKQSFSSSSTTSSMSLLSPDVQKYNLHPINQLRNGRYKEQQLDHVHNDLLKRCGSLDIFFDHCLKIDNDSFLGFISNSQEIKDVFKEKRVEEEMLSATGLADLKDDNGISDQVLRHLRRKSNVHLLVSEREASLEISKCNAAAQPTNLYHSELQYHDHGKLFQVEVILATFVEIILFYLFFTLFLLYPSYLS